MLDIRVNCPSCGAPISFRAGTMVSICAHCRALSARTDRDPKRIGQVADLVATGSRLALGMEGTFAGRAFALAGRTQLRHPLGGVWDEWYLAFPDARWGWLAEAQGKFYLTFRQALSAPPPALETLSPGSELNLGSEGRWAIAETSQATLASAEGEIPWDVEDLGLSYPFVDLHGRNGAFATLDYSETPPAFFVGRETTLADLKLTAVPPLPSGEKLKAQGLPCPHCASPLKLQAPDQAERVVCPSCGGLLDASAGRLTYLRSLKQPDPKMAIPLGTTGVLRGRNVVCAGFMIRTCVVEGETYPWREYLLLDQDRHAFLWLVDSDGHWSLAETINQAEIYTSRAPLLVQYKGQNMKRIQAYTATVKGVWGEFYWKVEQGEKAAVNEYTQAPYLLAEERQQHQGGGSEVNWSLSEYLEPGEVWTAFKLPGRPPAPQGIAPHQPNPHRPKSKRLAKWMWLAIAVWLLVLILQCGTHRNRLLYTKSFDVAAAAERAQQAKLSGQPPQEGTEAGDVVFFSEPIEIAESLKNVEITAKAPLVNAWIDVEGALAAEQGSAVEFFMVPLSYYHGIESGERWSEGSTTNTVYLSALPAGKYIMRLAPQWEGLKPPAPVLTIEVRSGVMHGWYWFLALLAILLPPLVQWLRVGMFEGERWANSSVAGGDA